MINEQGQRARNTFFKIQRPIYKLLAMSVLLALTACQSVSPTPIASSNVNVEQLFIEHSKQHDNPKKIFVNALSAHLQSERTAVSRTYYRAIPFLVQDSIDQGADPLWLTFVKLKDYEPKMPDDTTTAYRTMSDYMDEPEALYLRYDDELNGAPKGYALTRLAGMADAIQAQDDAIVDEAQRIYHCVQANAYELDHALSANPLLHYKDDEAITAALTLSQCLSEAKAPRQKWSDLTVYQSYDINVSEKCIFNYERNIQDVLSATRTIARYEGEDYDAYASVFGRFSLCMTQVSTGYTMDPMYYISSHMPEERLEFARDIKQCIVDDHIAAHKLLIQRKTYANAAKDYEALYYDYFACVNKSAERIYGQSLTVVPMTSVQESTEAMAQIRRLGDNAEELAYSSGRLGALQRYLAMKEAELDKTSAEPAPVLDDMMDKLPMVGISRLYSILPSKLLQGLKKSDEELLAANAYQYDNTQLTVVTRHSPSNQRYDSVLALDFTTPTASQHMQLPLSVDFSKGTLTTDASAGLPVLALLDSDYTPLPSDFPGDVGVVRFRLPSELQNIIPPSVLYSAVQRGYLQAMQELHPSHFHALAINDDKLAKQLGADTAISLQLGAQQSGVVLATIGKVVEQDLTTYIETHPAIFADANDELLSVSAELAAKEQQARKEAVKQFVHRWALLNKGYVTNDVGSLLQVIEAVLPIKLHYTGTYYLRNGALVGSTIYGDIQNMLTQGAVKSLTTTSYARDDFIAHPLSQALLPADIPALNGNAWLKERRTVNELQRDARYARYDYPDPLANEASDSDYFCIDNLASVASAADNSDHFCN